MHSNKIAHRDLKSANIFFTNRIAKIGDLNVSNVSETSMYKTKTGTPYYTAPEIWKGEEYSNKCDIWSLGCIVYEMCSNDFYFFSLIGISLMRSITWLMELEKLLELRKEWIRLNQDYFFKYKNMTF